MKTIPVRQAIHSVLQKMHIAELTHDRDTMRQGIAFLNYYLPLRNSGITLMIK